MQTVLQINFPFKGPFGPEMSQAMKALAESIATEPGLLWKIWTENAQTQEAGGLYLFSDAESAQSYLKMHKTRLTAAGITDIKAKLFNVNAPLSKICKGPIQ
ncbi:monooxygenase [Denitrificimonas sp. JX-1]|uniref:Monooxygenase n=1 Tax=Denitrificimonas halotolerans TaxID=3098930 RepID=A0ABU5GRD8_9GAMM|nr:monooxygenase [Denitrificimonas sp. JX-1]MDY7218940.1 monooxygenase [Denitrificimonas sp. JX-1]